jgi:5-methylcytosine-specific restriction endonuclease McrA
MSLAPSAEFADVCPAPSHGDGFVCEKCGVLISRGGPRGAKFTVPICRGCRERARGQQRAHPRISCAGCGVRFGDGTKVRQKWCSPCKKAIEASRYQKSPPLAKPCKWCGKQFKPKNHHPTFYCSTKCRQSPHWSKKDAARRMRGGKRITGVTINDIFTRDKWKCCFCGVRTPRELRGSQMPNSPELDHILPLSTGGDHSKVNLQLLCRRCNLRKGNKPLGQTWLALEVC